MAARVRAGAPRRNDARRGAAHPSTLPPPAYTHHPPPTPQAKELVESAPCLILQKVKREEATKVMEKLAADTGAELELV